MKRRAWTFYVALTVASAAPAIATRAAAAPAATFRSSGHMRALVLGVDDYKHVPRLKGATADARDLAKTLRQVGADDIRVMLNESATRGSVLAALDDLVTRAETGDTIFLTLSGHGAQEPERVKGSEPDGMNEVFLLADFDPKNPALYGEKIFDKEFNHFVKGVEDKGARVLFIADTCSGEGLARFVDPRTEQMSYRAVKYTPLDDNRPLAATRAEALMAITDFETSDFLAASEKASKSPEVNIPGVGFRGALSYAVARGLEGAADLDQDGSITTGELFSYVRRVTYQLSDQRQKIVAVGGRALESSTDVLLGSDRGIAVVPTRPTQEAVTIKPAPGVVKPTSSSPPPQANARIDRAAGPIRVASLDGKTNSFAGLSLQTPFEVVSPKDSPDLIWDPSTGQALSGGDVVTRGAGQADLPILIERAAAVRWLKVRAAQSPQAVRVFPDDKLYHRGGLIEVEVDGVANRSLVLFNLSGDGTTQLLYPLGSDPSIRDEPKYRLRLTVREPFGTDQIIAVTAPRQLPELEQALRQLDKRRNPMMISEIITRYGSPDALVGSAGLFTAP